MKIRVLKRFRDRHTGKVYEAGEVLEVEEARLKEILEVGKLAEPEGEPGKRTEKQKKEGLHEKGIGQHNARV